MPLDHAVGEEQQRLAGRQQHLALLEQRIVENAEQAAVGAHLLDRAVTPQAEGQRVPAAYQIEPQAVGHALQVGDRRGAEAQVVAPG